MDRIVSVFPPPHVEALPLSVTVFGHHWVWKEIKRSNEVTKVGLCSNNSGLLLRRGGDSQPRFLSLHMGIEERSHEDSEKTVTCHPLRPLQKPVLTAP